MSTVIRRAVSIFSGFEQLPEFIRIIISLINCEHSFEAVRVKRRPENYSIAPAFFQNSAYFIYII